MLIHSSLPACAFDEAITHSESDRGSLAKQSLPLNHSTASFPDRSRAGLTWRGAKAEHKVSKDNSTPLHTLTHIAHHIHIINVLCMLQYTRGRLTKCTELNNMQLRWIYEPEFPELLEEQSWLKNKYNWNWLVPTRKSKLHTQEIHIFNWLFCYFGFLVIAIRKMTIIKIHVSTRNICEGFKWPNLFFFFLFLYIDKPHDIDVHFCPLTRRDHIRRAHHLWSHLLLFFNMWDVRFEVGLL